MTIIRDPNAVPLRERGEGPGTLEFERKALRMAQDQEAKARREQQQQQFTVGGTAAPARGPGSEGVFAAVGSRREREMDKRSRSPSPEQLRVTSARG